VDADAGSFRHQAMVRCLEAKERREKAYPINNQRFNIVPSSSIIHHPSRDSEKATIAVHSPGSRPGSTIENHWKNRSGFTKRKVAVPCRRVHPGIDFMASHWASLTFDAEIRGVGVPSRVIRTL
jgi:hypothetical protein